MANDIIKFGLIGVGGYLLYEYLTNPNFLGSSSNVPTTTTTTTSTNTNSASTLGSGGSASVSVPALGTLVSSASDIANQAAAGLAYIIPAQSIPNLISLTPNNYTATNTTDMGTIFLRNNVYSAVQSVVQNNITRMTNAYSSQGLSVPLGDIQNAGNMTLGQIQTIMSTNGLAGLGHVFPINGGYGFGKIVTVNPYSTPMNYQANVTGWEMANKSN